MKCQYCSYENPEISCGKATTHCGLCRRLLAKATLSVGPFKPIVMRKSGFPFYAKRSVQNGHNTTKATFKKVVKPGIELFE